MKKTYLLKSAVIALAAPALCACAAGDGWKDLFNGKNLDGFHQTGGAAPFEIKDNALVGRSVQGEPNSFMVTKQLFGDFILEFDVLCDPSLNSGVQFRSETDPSGRVYGYQCEIDPSERAWSGGIYDEARRGWLVTLQGHELGRTAYKTNDWNHYRIEAFGDTMRVWLNGVNTANLLDNATPSGFIAFQVHSIGKDASKDGKEVKWKNIRILTGNIHASLTQQGTLITEINRVPNTLSTHEKSHGWKLLFDGLTANGWRGAHRDAFPDKGWEVKDGVITVTRSGGGEAAHGGDIVTLNEYAAFELSLEFKITRGANSGVKYFVTENEKQHGSSFGLEYQILDDDVHPDAKQYTSVPGSRTCASLYDLIKAQNKRFNGVGQWNQAVVKVFPDNHVEHWLNGFKTLEYERGSETFRNLVKGSKYAAKEYNAGGLFGEAPQGRILLQDHGDEVSFRSIKIKELSR